jgi:hypothetical protein
MILIYQDLALIIIRITTKGQKCESPEYVHYTIYIKLYENAFKKTKTSTISLFYYIQEFTILKKSSNK